MKTKELWNLIEEICPLTLAEEWDNSGPQISFDNQDVSKVLVALEITYAVIEEAVRIGADCIVTHHPLYFDGNAYITPEFTIGAYTLELVKHKISVYSAHTNFDNLVGGNNDYFAQVLGIKEVTIPDVQGSIYRTGTVDSRTVGELIDDICNALSIDKSFVHLVGNKDVVVSRVGWCTGAGFDFIYDAYNEGIECYITGDVKYHDARDAAERGMNVIDIGHFGSEKIFAHNMAEKLMTLSGIEIIESEMDIDPFFVN